MAERMARVLIKVDDKFIAKCAEDGGPYDEAEWIKGIEKQLEFVLSFDKVKYEFIEFEPTEVE